MSARDNETAERVLEALDSVVVKRGGLSEQIDEVREHVQRLEAHIRHYGPKEQHSDPSIVGVPRWEAPYSPAPWTDG